MSLLVFDAVSLEFGDLVLLRDADLVVEPGERVCLLGRNGAGKSTAMRLITGEIEPDRGEIRRRPYLKVSQLAQALPEDLQATVFEFVAEGLSELRKKVRAYEALASAQSSSMPELEALHREIDAASGWNIDQRVQTVLSEMSLPGSHRLEELSGGWRRRVGLARSLVSDPDLLLLDEPTNHLDLATIEWLERRMLDFAGSIVFVTHDRVFLQRLATRIVELDRARLISWPGTYRDYLIAKEKAVAEEERSNAHFDKHLAREEAWIRQGIKARRTRNEGRVKALEELRAQAAGRMKPQGRVRMYMEEGQRSGRKVIEAYRVTYGYADRRLIENFSLKVKRGDRIGLVGNNGVGKSTLMRLLLGKIQPRSGTVKLGTHLEIGYFDPLAADLDPNRTVADIVGDGREYVTMEGKERHIIGYLRSFLFTPKRAREKVGTLSGGERNRVRLAKLFTRPTNLLLLDEPTNDLDVETLEVLEDRLLAYGGTLIVVSHDREFLDNVVSSILVFEASGDIEAYVGGYKEWAARGRRLAQADRPRPDPEQAVNVLPTPADNKPRKMSYKLKYELEQLPDRIEALEREVAALEAQSAASDFYTRPYHEVRTVLGELGAKQQSLEELIGRWGQLEDMERD